MSNTLNGTLDVHLEPAPDGYGARIVLLLTIDGYDGPFRVVLSPNRARQLARTLAELADRQGRVARAGDN